ncbi:LytR C-terminal domain-containing protein [Nocardioides lianchengensis]|uniref:LytR cell envelope-related transcriptional attenuator n=1 Tax=Nocardioides lianchengensis TaxID=1045774 RepID=A0A1G6Q740_9ACTN|nr:LytR C-terminal domain-containing protein [Nocardioides lianchengensis]NYG12098.1 hypothetical protein [Nocardioides lianchengensis]SDC87457.1 LytR cell envelope-related transcriptional attenuator [Nocardioides lianchengensis]
MSQAARTATTLLVLLALLVVGLAWGWSAATSPLPESAVEVDDCTSTEVSEGDTVQVDQVLVSVLNAGKRSGLASRTMQLLVEQGFAAGDRGNAPDSVTVGKAQIWTDEPNSPAVRLVQSWLGRGVEVVPAPVTTTVSGVVVVVGDDFRDLSSAGRDKATSKVATTICSPPPPELAS